MKYGLLGRTLGHSYSPAIHRRLGDGAYELFEREPEDVEAFLRSGCWDGLNVTIPYKKTVIPYLDALSEAARKTGSVNTIVRRRDGTLFGDNTDVFGFSGTVCRSGIDVSGKKALVLGSGGASAAIRYALTELGAVPVVISRSDPDGYGGLGRYPDAEILVNATPVGMFPDTEASPLDLAPAGSGFDALPALRTVFDAIYNPARTKLLQEAKKRGIRAINGLGMLVRQAARSRELFTGEPVPIAALDRIEAELRKEMRNVVLIGMPGAGKTTVGRMVAEKTGRPFIDTDEAIERRTGKPVERILEEEGEEAFRTLEAEILREAGKRSGTVIATGGGCVTREENEERIRRNGVVVWLKRPLALLRTNGRPLSLRKGVEALYEERKELYARFSDVSVANGGTLSEALDAITDAVL